MTAQPDSLTSLREALDCLSVALVAGRPDGVLAAEESLGAAARQLAAHLPAAGTDPAGLADTIRAIRVAVFTCELLGRASASLIQATVAGGSYGANGHLAPAAVSSTVVSRT